MRVALAFALCIAATFAHPSAPATTVPRKRTTKPGDVFSPPAAADGEDGDIYEADGAREEGGAFAVPEDLANASAAETQAVPRSSKPRVKKKASKASQPKKRKAGGPRRAKPAAPPPPSMLAGLTERVTKLKEDFNTQYRERSAQIEAREELRRQQAEAHRLLVLERVEQLREANAARREGEGGGHDPAEEAAAAAAAAALLAEEEAAEITMAEKGAMVGSIMFSAGGIAGMMVGGAFGGAAGYMTEKVEAVRSYVAGAYGERVAVEKQNSEQMAAAAKNLKALNDVAVRSDDEEEAVALTAALLAFLAMPCNKRCADCNCKMGKPNTVWASVNHGVVLCVRCAGVHRSLGVRSSRVKSLVFDAWDAQMAKALLDGGNDAARANLLARLPRGYAEPTLEADDERLATFIRNKYVKLRWADPEFKKGRLAADASRPAVGSTKKFLPKNSDRATPMPSLSSEG